MTDFWRSSGYHLLARNTDGWLELSDDYLRAYFNRPELHPVEESCAAEIALHSALLDDPRCAVAADRLAEIADPDARENFELVLAFRDRLVGAGTIEGCYLSLFRAGDVTTPPLFIDQMAHVILRNILDGCDDPLRVRAGEALFRAQKVSLQDGAIMLADEETVSLHAESGGFGDLGRLIADAETPKHTIELDVLGEANGALYWQRDERHDTVIDMSFARPALDALCRVLEAWVRHFLFVDVVIQPVMHIRDKNWAWHIGLDAEASAMLNDLYDGQEFGEDRLRRLLSLFRLEFRDPALMRPDIAGRPVYLGMAMDGANVLRLKPQNLLVNLPVMKGA
ncbi:MAG: DUF6352 family protein [Alphaproteobacteria bacterium]